MVNTASAYERALGCMVILRTDRLPTIASAAATGTTPDPASSRAGRGQASLADVPLYRVSYASRAGWTAFGNSVTGPDPERRQSCPGPDFAGLERTRLWTTCG